LIGIRLDLIEVTPRRQSQRDPKYAINKTGMDLIKQFSMRRSINAPTFTSVDGCVFINDRPYGRAMSGFRRRYEFAGNEYRDENASP
jgi:hypothetical protein